METDWTKHWIMSNNILWGTWTWRIAYAYKKLLKNIKLNDVRIIELGSGSGVNSLKLAKIFKAKEITLVDSSKKAIDFSKKMFENANLNVSYLKKDILKLDLKEKFDIVHSEGLIEHFYDKKRLVVFKKHIDLCKEGGIVIIFTPHENINYRVFRGIYKKFNKWIWNEEPLTKEQIHNLCKQFKIKILNEYSSPLIHEIGVVLKK